MLRQQGYQLKHLLKAMPMSKSTYYFELTKVDLVDKRNTELKDEIQKIFTEHKGRYGVRRVYQELLNRGFVVNHKRVQRLMHSMGLAGKRPKEKYYSYKGIVGYLDMNTNEIVAYDLPLRPNLEQFSRMLEKAFKKFTNLLGLIFYSDQGWQYQHNYFRQVLKEYGII